MKNIIFSLSQNLLSWAAEYKEKKYGDSLNIEDLFKLYPKNEAIELGKKRLREQIDDVKEMLDKGRTDILIRE